MKKIILLILITSIHTTFLTAQESKKINLIKSKISWQGSKLFGFGEHTGTVNFKAGKIIKKEHEFIGGEFIIDMQSIRSNESETWVEDLINHLKGEDFFDVKNNPTSKLVMTYIKNVGDGYMQIKANLSINKITKPIHFNAKLNDSKTQIDCRFKIDRNRWNITYKSQGKTSIKNQIISDAITFKINLHL